MSSFNKAVMTENGLNLLTKAFSGEIILEFVKMVYGSGEYTDAEKASEVLKKSTALKEVKQESYFSSRNFVNANTVSLKALLSNESVTEGYYINEIGIYAKAQGAADNTAILYSIAVAEIADYLPAFNGSNPAQIIQEYYVSVNDVENISITIKNGAVALAEDLETLKTQVANKAASNHTHSDYVPKNSPVFTGSISLGRKDGTTVGSNSHAVGLNVEASGGVSHAEGEATIARTVGSHAEGKSTEAGQANGQSYCHAEGVNSRAYGRGSHAEGESTLSQGQYSHAEGGGCEATGDYSHAEGCNSGNTRVTSSGTGSHAEGRGTTSSGSGSHSEGELTVASGDYSHAEGGVAGATSTLLEVKTTSSGYASHAEGLGTQSKNNGSHSEGVRTIAELEASHSEGSNTQALGNASHAEGMLSIAKGTASHAEGYNTQAKQYGSHTEGIDTIANGTYSHAEGDGTIAGGKCQHVQGKYNVEDTEEKYAHIVGGGKYNSGNPIRKNIHTLDWNGNAEFAGDVVVTDKNGNKVSLAELSTNDMPKIALLDDSFTIITQKVYRIGHLAFVSVYLHSTTPHTGRLNPISLTFENTTTVHNQVLACTASSSHNQVLKLPLGCFVSTDGMVYVDAEGITFHDIMIGGTFFVE